MGDMRQNKKTRSGLHAKCYNWQMIVEFMFVLFLSTMASSHEHNAME